MSTQKPLSYRLRADLFAQLAQMELAGLPVDRAFAVIGLPPPAQQRLDTMRQLMKRGGELALAGEKSGVFTKLEARLIRAATNAGSPANMYRRLADYYTDRALQLSTMKSRMALPAFMFVAALLIQPIPALVGGSLGIAGYLWQVAKPVLLIVAAFFAFRFFTSSESQSSSKAFYQSVPIYGPIFVRRNLRDFFESLALMLEAGVSMLDALPAALDTVEDGDIRRELAKIRLRIESGAPLADALGGVNYLKDDHVIQFVKTGEASGTLPEMLMRHARVETEAINSFYEQLAAWAPRVLYAMVAMWIAYGIISGGAMMPRVPSDL